MATDTPDSKAAPADEAAPRHPIEDAFAHIATTLGHVIDAMEARFGVGNMAAARDAHRALVDAVAPAETEAPAPSDG